MIDTDPGVDDAFAIALAALSPDVELLAVTTVYGNVPLEATSRNALRLLELCGRDDVPVAAGAERPLVYPHRARDPHDPDGLSGYSDSLPEPRHGLFPHGAVDLMARLISESSEPVTIAPIGPLTNIALLLATYPGVKQKIDRIVLMGGGLAIGNVTASAEFNIWSDPEAARRVLVEPDVPTVMVPMDLTYHCAVDTGWLDSLAEAGPVGAALTALTPDHLGHYRKVLGWDGIVLHDVVAVAEAIQPGLLHTMELPVDVECSLGPSRGATVVDRRRAELHAETPDGEQDHGVAVAVNTNIEELRGFVLERLSQSPRGGQPADEVTAGATAWSERQPG
ncbi:MAG: nucleoside hydrolase [Sciscionella sp.]